jgi:importin-5
MPLLLDALENANGPDYRKLRQKAMECAGLIGKLAFVTLDRFVLIFVSAIAVGRDVFRQDSDRFVEALMRIQSGHLSHCPRCLLT